jgi:hypothetical protein
VFDEFTSDIDIISWMLFIILVSQPDTDMINSLNHIDNMSDVSYTISHMSLISHETSSHATYVYIYTYDNDSMSMNSGDLIVSFSSQHRRRQRQDGKIKRRSKEGSIYEEEVLLDSLTKKV